MHRIAEKLRAQYIAQIGHKPSPSEVASWQNSLMALSMLVDQAELNDHGAILEYQLGNTSRRLEAMLTGHASTSAENAYTSFVADAELDNAQDITGGSNPFHAYTEPRHERRNARTAWTRRSSSGPG